MMMTELSTFLRAGALALIGTAMLTATAVVPAHAQNTTAQGTTTQGTTTQRAPAPEAGEAKQLVDRARLVVQDMKKDPAFGNSQDLLRRARAVLIVPNLIKAGFFFGGEGGRGVLLARTADGSWSPPAFYTLGSASFGLQIGIQSAELVMFIMSEKALDALMRNKVTLGAQAGIAVVAVGSNVAAGATTNVNADVFVWASAQGAYIGVTLEGSVVEPNEEWNAAYYKQAVTVPQILSAKVPADPSANVLRAELAGRAS
jgi:lipid-binding SYLF domain-containing protein